MQVKKLVFLLAAIALMSSACSSGNDTSAAAAGSATSASAVAPPSVKDSSEADEIAGVAQADGTSVSAPDLNDATSPDAEAATQAGKKASKVRLQPMDFPQKVTVDVSAELSVQCAARGESISIVIQAPPESAVAYQAAYADNQGGADPPYGMGYGGNAWGAADQDGRFESTWVIGPKAPYGRGRVDVVVGYDGEWGYADPHFAVADANGDCPDKWLQKDS